MRVAYLSASGRIGGAERALLDLLASLRAAEPDWELHVVVAGEGPLAERAAALGATVHRFPMPRLLEALGDAGGGSRAALLARLLAAAPAGMLWLRRLRGLLRSIAPGVVHTNGFKMHVAAAMAMPERARLVWHIHDYVAARRVMASALRHFADRPAAAVAVSRSVADDVRRVCGAGMRVETVYNAVDLDRFTPEGDRIPLHALAGMPPEAPGTVSVGLVATMGLWKGHDVFLRAISLIPRELPVRAYVVGGRIYATAGSEVDPDELREMAGALGIADRTGFTGFVEDSAAVMRSLDVVVHASTQPEPFGLVIAEAMACGRAVVVSAAGGAAEIVSDGADALAVAPGDAAAMAAAIGRLIGDADLRARLGIAGREKAKREFDRARLAREIVPLYRSLGM
ncbi:glycosyltransferase family 4 protein [Longimicrobium sp.]|uniref:glycosyltransferase family 4 protein n=1 Tax=Longimicrobium sp. TaxID=2029185 RepID=UPI002C40B86E|nr:glycosyltransferase family 4 protein [Longimicrobium sp.]HSU15203.1 glycosyltransferase family 4 protein [Longimicrobium sp.]